MRRYGRLDGVAVWALAAHYAVRDVHAPCAPPLPSQGVTSPPPPETKGYVFNHVRGGVGVGGQMHHAGATQLLMVSSSVPSLGHCADHVPHQGPQGLP